MGPDSEIQIDLRSTTSLDWVKTVEANLDTFLQDHAACERKASATGINFVVQYPDRSEIIDPMIHLAREELLHFQQVCKILKNRGVTLVADEKTPYVNQLIAQIRTGRDARLLDRLLIFGIIEARGTERFGLLGDHLADPELRLFYKKLEESEVRHQGVYLNLARHYFSDDLIKTRLNELLNIEAQIISSLPLRPAVH